MQSSKFQVKIKSFINPIFIIVIAALLRLVPHPPNFAPIAAMALFGGTYLDKKYALVIPLLAMFLSDTVLGFHNTMIFVYGSFFLIGCIGLWLKSHRSFPLIALATFASSVLFFIITNFGVWAISPLYPRTLHGLFECYYYAIPFFRNTIMGDFFYIGVLFGGYEIVSAKFKMQSSKV